MAAFWQAGVQRGSPWDEVMQQETRCTFTPCLMIVAPCQRACICPADSHSPAKDEQYRKIPTTPPFLPSPVSRCQSDEGRKTCSVQELPTIFLIFESRVKVIAMCI